MSYEKFPFEADGKVLEQSKESAGLLGVDRNEKQRLRNDPLEKLEDAESFSNSVPGDTRSASQEAGGSSPVRQSGVRESEAPSSGDSKAEHPGRDKSWKVSQRNNEQNPLQEGAQASRARPDGKEELHTMPAEKSSRPPTQERAEIALKEGVSNPNSVEQQFRLAKLYISSRMLPDRFKTPEEVVTAIHFASEHFPRSPLTALRQIAVIKGNPTMFGDLPLAKVQQSAAYGGKKEYFIDKEMKEISIENKNINSEVWGAVCTTTRRSASSSGSDVHTTTFTMDDAKTAGLLGSDAWRKYPMDMLKYRARGRNLKDNFADCLVGVGQGEFDNNLTLSTIRERDVHGIADEINSEYLGEKSEQKN